MFLERKKLNMGESILDRVIGEQRGHLTISERAIIIFRNPPPRAKVHFVNRKRLAPRLSFFTLRQPGTVAELIFRFEYDRRGVGRHLHHQGVRIGLQKLMPAGLDFVFVELALSQAGYKELPDSGTAQVSHRMSGAVPFVEVTDHADALGIRRPDGECDSALAFMSQDMRAELFINMFVSAFTEQMQVEFAERGREVL